MRRGADLQAGNYMLAHDWPVREGTFGRRMGIA